MLARGLACHQEARPVQPDASNRYQLHRLMKEKMVCTCAWPSVRYRISASLGPACPPERELMNAISGASGSSGARNFFVAVRKTGGILRRACVRSHTGRMAARPWCSAAVKEAGGAHGVLGTLMWQHWNG